MVVTMMADMAMVVVVMVVAVVDTVVVAVDMAVVDMIVHRDAAIKSTVAFAHCKLPTISTAITFVNRNSVAVLDRTVRVIVSRVVR